MVTEQESMVIENFCGKPYEFKIKDNKEIEHTFLLEQLNVKLLPKFLPLLDKWFDIMNKKDFDKLSTPEFLEECMPFIENMIEISFPNWTKKTKESFILNNILVLIQPLFMANAGIISSAFNQINDKVEFENFVNAQKEKIDGQPTNIQ